MGCCQSTRSRARASASTSTSTSTSTSNGVLSDCTYDNTEPYFPSFTVGKVVKIYDGDTIHVVADDGTGPFRYMIRMYGYDSPELKTAAGADAKAALVSKILNKIVRIEVHRVKEKYGRVLATIYDGECNINLWMIKHGYGVPYDGGKKTLS